MSCALLASLEATAHGEMARQTTASNTKPESTEYLKTTGFSVFSENCAPCHATRADPDQRAPSVATLQSLPPEAILAALTTGKMVSQGQGLKEEEKRAVAEYLGGRAVADADTADSQHMANRCAARDAGQVHAVVTSEWNGWGAREDNGRFQAAGAAGLMAAQVPRLKLKWAFGFPLAAQAYSQPTVAGGRVYVGSDSGFVYALDAKSGCVYWSFRAKAGVRVAISVSTREAAHPTVYFADLRAHVYAIDASSGQLLWTSTVDDHPLAAVTGSPILFERKLYVPVSSGEEDISISPRYSCCTFRGSVVALDADTGRQVWKTFTITEEPHKQGVNSLGTPLFAPSGGAIWGSPTIDTRRRLLYVGTGNGYSVPTAPMTDSILSLALDTGRLTWSYQATRNDSWILACFLDRTHEPCPTGSGPDFDFGSSPILQRLPDGHDMLLAAHKGGTLIAFDPARSGTVLWQRTLVSTLPTASGEFLFGGAADGRRIYLGFGSGGIAAVDLKSGRRAWWTGLTSTDATASHVGQIAALTVIPGVVFSGGLDGVLRAFATDDGHEIWHVETARTFSTVNGVAAHGGSMGAPGPVVVDGMLYVGSGCVGTHNGMPGNVLLAFAP